MMDEETKKGVRDGLDEAIRLGLIEEVGFDRYKLTEKGIEYAESMPH